MQDEVNAKMTGLAKESGKMSLRLLWKMAKKVMSDVKTKLTKSKTTQTTKITKGKTTVKKLAAQDRGMKCVELSETKDVPQFDRIMKRYGLDYAIKRDAAGDKSKSMVFYKAQDTDVFELAMKEFSQRKIQHASKPCVLQKMETFKAKIKPPIQKEQVKEPFR